MRLSQYELNKMLKGSYAKVKGNIRSQATNTKPDSLDEIKRANAFKTFDKRVVITVHSFRYRYADPDGLYFKHHLDSIVKAGILKDDSCKYVEEVRFKQTKIKKPEEERTVVILEEI